MKANVIACPLLLALARCTVGAIESGQPPPSGPATTAPSAPDAGQVPDATSAAPDAGSPPAPDAGGPSTGPSCTGEETSLLPQGQTQLANLCARGYTDPISQAFCASPTPNITSLADVLKVVGLGFGPGPYNLGVPNESGANGNPSFILTAQSSAISTRKVSQINPRAIIFTKPLGRGRLSGTPHPNPSYVAMGFTRGDQAIELLAKDPVVGIRFFLLKYQQACNSAPGGCTPGDLYTPAVESNFTSWSLYDDQDLKDTTQDCLQCHQPGGPGSPRMLRMQELQRPWTHWMYNDANGHQAQRADFHAAHGTNETYGGIPGPAIDAGDVQQLEAFVENNGFIMQPNEFQGVMIENEITASGMSSTWQSQYQASESGLYIPVPYYGPMATDPTKVQPLIQQYAAVVAGTMPTSQLGDMSDVFSDPAQRAMTHKPALGLSGPQILVQICQQCHNSQLDQSISRARFNVLQLASLSRAEKDEAIRRINLPTDDCSHMPPFRFRELDANEISLVETELQK
jgi:hypothetical protein